MSDPRIWGASAAEVADAYPCDALGFEHDEAYFRAVSIAAPRPLVFRWLCQLRVAPYSYDLLDNFARRSPPHLIPGLETLATGQRMMTIFRLAGFEPQRSLTVALSSRLGRRLMGDFAGSYVVADDVRGVRLVAKILVRYPRGVYGRALRRWMPALDLFMFRKQLETLKAYAERDARGSA